MTRRLGITKRIDLTGLADGWDGCYVLVKPLTYKMLGEVVQIDADNITEAEAIEKTAKIVKDNVIGGKVMVLDDNGNLQQDDLQSDDVDSMSVEMINHIMSELSGQGAQYGDPKGLSLPTSSEESQSSSSTHVTTSSTDSPATSPATS